MKKTIKLLMERWGLATILFLLWQLGIATMMLLTATTHKTSLSTQEHWTAWGAILAIWLANLAATHHDGREYLCRGHFPDKLFVPALYHIIFITVTAGAIILQLHP